jgi:anti-sigma factor RsiW
MYLADELPPGDRQIVETRLSGSEALRAELETLQSAQELIGRELAASDRLHPPAGAAELRPVTRAIRQWHAQRARESVAATVPRGRASWWLYPAAAAVAAVIVYTVWWGFQDAEPGSLRNPASPNAPSAYASNAGDERAYGRSYNPSESSGLDDAELELDQLVMLRTMTQ